MLRKVDWKALTAILGHLDARWASLGWALSLLLIAGLALRWQIFLRQQGIKIPFTAVFSLTWAGQFFNSILPGATGGDVVKVMNEHTEEQGLRVHHLVNLGGLIAVAGLDREPPDFLLGALVSVAHERLTSEQRARVASLGREKLDERATAKRAWKSWRRSKDLHSLTLSGAQVRRLIAALGSAAPEDSRGW